MSRDDQTLVQHSLAGEHAAFEELVRRYSPRIFRLIYRFFGDAALVEDIAQDVFLRAYSSLKTYRRQSPFEHWISAIAMNTCYRQLRVQRTQRDFRAAELTADECQVLDSLCLTSSGREAGNPEKRALLRDLAEKIMLQLTPPEQMILTLMEVDGLTVEEIARLWGMSRVSVKVRAYRARKHALKIFRTLAKTPQQP